MMTKKALAEAKWSALRAEMRQIMVTVARSQHLITYSELCAQLTTAYLYYHSPAVTRLLIEIGDAEMKVGRPVLPAVVVSKSTGMPGAGYFKLAMGERDDPQGARALWEADLAALYAYWSSSADA
jgi:hypothetical protein